MNGREHEKGTAYSPACCPGSPASDVATGDSDATVHVSVTNIRMTLEELQRLPPGEVRRRHREALRLPDGRSDYNKGHFPVFLSLSSI